MTPDLTTTNVLLGIMAAVSVLEGLAIAGLLLGGFLIYRKVERLLAGIEERHVAPAAARVNAILDDLKGVTSVATNAAEGAESGLQWALAWLLRYLRPWGHAA
jgi:hypothetical protein